MYDALKDLPVSPKPFSWIWKSCCQSKQKFFFWLLLYDRLNTRDLMARKNFYVEDNSCVLCPNEANEFRMHLSSNVNSVLDLG